MFKTYKCIFDNNVELKIPIYSGDNSDKKKMYDFYNGGSLLLREKKKRQIIINLINKSLIDKNQNIIDAGAFLGDTSLPLSLNITGNLYTIDPGIINMEIIKEIIDLNGIKNIKLLPYCLSDTYKKLYYNKGKFGINFTSFSDNEVNKEYSVESYSLDILYNKNIIENISLLHIDVEGQELAVIKGSINLITKYNPIIIFEGHIKTNTSQVISCCDFLKNINYNLFMINEDAGNPGDCRNFLCIPTNKITEFNNNFDFMNFITNVTNEYNNIKEIEL